MNVIKISNDKKGSIVVLTENAVAVGRDKNRHPYVIVEGIKLGGFHRADYLGKINVEVINSEKRMHIKRNSKK